MLTLDAPNEISAPDLDLFRETLNGHFYPARIEALGRPSRLDDPRVSAVHLSMTTIGHVRPGVTASVDPGELPGYHVNVPLSGTVVSRCGEAEVVASPRIATVFSPGKHSSLPRWNRDAAQLSIKFTRTRVEEELAALLGHPVVRPIDFRLDFPVDRGPGAQWRSILAALLHSAAPGLDRLRARHLDLLERSLISSLLLAQPHSYSAELTAEPKGATPGTSLDRVVDEIGRAPDRGYTVADLARLSGLSARSLQYAFREKYQLTPMQYVRQVRLDRVHDDLAAGAGTVADIAAYWGFTNPGRFARAYRDRFNEYPAATREDARAVRVR